MAIGVFIVLISNVFYVLPAPIVRQALDFVVNEVPHFQEASGQQKEVLLSGFYHKLLYFVGLILLVSLARGLFLYLQRQILIGLSRYIEFDLKNEVYAHYQKLPLSFYRKNNTGDLMARISEDVSQVRMYVGPSIMYGLNLAALFLVVIPFMFSVDVKLTLYVLLPLPLLSVSIYYVNSLINKRSTEIQRGLSRLSTFVQEAFSGIRVIKSFGREDDSSERLEQESNSYREKSMRLVRVVAYFFPLILLLTGLSTILIVYVGGMQVIEGKITYGVIAEFVMYVNMLTWPVASLGWITSLIQRAEASQTRINEFLKTENPIVSEGNVSRKIEGKVVFQHVNFTYPDSGIRALKDISFDVMPGESLAILGTTGSGKSTIANLIARLYDCDSGQITIDGVPIKDYSVESLRSQIGYVPQDVFLFSDTIRNNIAFGRSDAPEEIIIQASRDADLFENIKGFPEGFKTVLGERGITLSGGQKQRLSIARAIVREPQILILDDSLSAVDTNTEHNILNSLKKIMVGKTTFIITHRISTSKLADKIILLDEGKIIQSGTHESLALEEGPYKELVKRQVEEVV